MRTLIGTVLAVVITTTGAVAQTAPSAATISPAQEAKIKEFVADEHRTSVAVPASFRLSVGAEVPQSVEIYEFNEDLGLSQHRYTIISGKTVIVDPGTRKVLRIME